MRLIDATQNWARQLEGNSTNCVRSRDLHLPYPGEEERGVTTEQGEPPTRLQSERESSMAKIAKASAAEKIAYLRANRKKFKTSSEANKLLQKKFGTGLIYGQISKALGLKRQTPVRKARKTAKRGPGRPPGSGLKKRGPGRPRGSGLKKRGPGRPRGRGKARTATPPFLVIVPGRGRSWVTTACASKDAAIECANAALARGTNQKKIGIYTPESYSVRSSPQIQL